VTLRAVRADFIEFSGRYDLVVDTTNYVDAGADKYIRMGQKWLSRTFEIGAKNGIHYVTLAAGDWFVLVPDARAMREVWMSPNENGDKWQLRKLSQEEWRNEAPADPATINNGRPLFWAHAILRSVPEVQNVTTVARYGVVAYNVTDNHWAFNGIVWTPPIDRVTTLEVHGNFYHPELNTDGDMNYWTEEESNVLVMAACRALEQSYRNMQGMLDWESAIKSELIGAEFDLADDEAIGTTAMESTGL